MSENKESEKLRLNLGSGDRPIEGYINIDFRKECNPDVVCDVRELPYEDNSVEKIIAYDLLEHFGRLETETILLEWYRVLKSGGQMIIKTPNVDTIIDAYKTHQIPFDEFIRKMYGGQDFDGNYHYTGFCPENIKQLLERVGFKVFKISMHLEGGDYFNMAIRCQK